MKRFRERPSSRPPANPRPRPKSLSLDDWLEVLPAVLSWDTEPDVLVGDRFVLERGEIIDTMLDVPGGEPIRSTFDAVYLEIIFVGRNKQGRHIAKYILHGADRPEYLAPKSGYTTSPGHSIDPEAAVLPIQSDQGAEDVNASIRERRRLLERRAANDKRLAQTDSEITRRILIAQNRGIDSALTRLAVPEEAAA